MSWFIESWAPLSGHVFAVHRNYTIDGARNERLWLDADEIYVVSPPDFSPLPCATEATTLWATRGPFQHKFLQPDGSEYSFDSLADLVELVRRVYLAGGVNPPPILDFPPPPLPDLPLSAPWQDLLDALDDRDASAIDPSNPRRLRPAQPAQIARAAQLIEAIMDAHRDPIRHLSIWSLRALVGAAASLDVTKGEEQAWALIVAEMNAWSSWQEASTELASACAGPHPAHGQQPPCWPFGTSGLLEDVLLNGLLWSVPAPWAASGRPGAGRLGFLGDHLSLAMADTRYRQELTSPARALPLFVCALAIAAPHSWDFRSGALARGVASVRQRAARWLAEHLPSALVKLPGAERAIDQVLDHRAAAKAIPGATP
jgi:hypothetical protein